MAISDDLTQTRHSPTVDIASHHILLPGVLHQDNPPTLWVGGGPRMQP